MLLPENDTTSVHKMIFVILAEMVAQLYGAKGNDACDNLFGLGHIDILNSLSVVDVDINVAYIVDNLEKHVVAPKSERLRP